ncbi:hypothetical protein HS141_16185 [Cetobacterium somerae]|uniref:hypothetical protein n=1 Tax=Cetobacterium somerae TaxID=188913 RepID=UPI00211E1FCE|nr:hypothetical protein [Cetobacterium somerae]MCQ9628458.1 hypothetical protein [Cetobacterium somerae]
MELNADILKDIGLVGIVIFNILQIYKNKDNQQNNQNDLLVQNLMESNKKKDELLERTVANFEKYMASIVNKLEEIDKKI